MIAGMRDDIYKDIFERLGPFPLKAATYDKYRLSQHFILTANLFLRYLRGSLAPSF